jgi:hypothetical protein
MHIIWRATGWIDKKESIVIAFEKRK